MNGGALQARSRRRRGSRPFEGGAGTGDEAAATFEAEITELEAAHAEARSIEAEARAKLTESERKAQKLGTEAQTLSKLLNAASGGFWPPVTDEITVAKGFEAALGAALGDDLDASTNPSAPGHWAETDRRDDPPLPGRRRTLSELVTAPAALARRLNQIGLVSAREVARWRVQLKPGQRLVSKEGDLWRWDGFGQAAERRPRRRAASPKRTGSEISSLRRKPRGEADALKAEADAAQKQRRCLRRRRERRAAQPQNRAAPVETAREKHTAANAPRPPPPRG